MLFVALIAFAFAKDVVCESTDGTFAVYPLGECVDMATGQSMKVEKDGSTYKATTYAVADCAGEGETKNAEGTCAEGDVPAYIAYMLQATAADCSDKKKYAPMSFYKSGCFAAEKGSIKYEIDADKKTFTETTFPDSNNCAEAESKVVTPHTCGTCEGEALVHYSYECDTYDFGGDDEKSGSGAAGVFALLAFFVALLF